MKSALIQKYFILKMARLNGASRDSLDLSLVALDMMRIDFILFNRYGFDISITRKYN